MLPVKDLAYPGSAETSREFSPADKGTTIHGRKYVHDARLSILYEFQPSTAPADILGWYRGRLIADGWTETDDLDRDGSELDMRTVRDGLTHHISVVGWRDPRTWRDNETGKPFFRVIYVIDTPD